MLDILVISPYYPSCQRSGSAARLAAILEHFRAGGNSVELVFAFRKAHDCPQPADLVDFVDRVTILDLAGCRVPGIQSLHLQKVLQPRRSRLGRALQSFERRITHSQDASEIVARIVARQRPQVVWIDHSFLAPLISKVPPDSAFRVVDTHDVMHLRDESLRQAGLRSEAGLTREQETQLLKPFDVILAIQDQERHILQEMLPDKQVITVAHSARMSPQPCRRPSLCFVGSAYEVNVETAVSFIATAWPQVSARCPDATLELVGGLCQNGRLQSAAAADNRIVLRGVVPSIDDIYKGPAAAICPLWMGSGLKIKLVEALAHGKATIASPVAAQGLEDGIDRGFLHAASLDAFVEPAVRLLTDAPYRRHWEQAALRYAARFQPDVVYRQLDQLPWANPRNPAAHCA